MGTVMIGIAGPYKSNLIMTNSKMSHQCKCGKPGTYRYSYELTRWLKLLAWEGVYLCDKCMKKTTREWGEARKASNAKVHVD